MHNLEPHYLWSQSYKARLDPKSPFYGYENSEVYFTDAIYDHLIHPQWDYFGAETLYMKQLYTNYHDSYTILEFIGEWNDILHNDIMHLKRNILEPIMGQGIEKFILIGDNILNFHAGDADYYDEWFEELGEGWISLINFREHILREIREYNLDQYLIFGGELDDMYWRKHGPVKLYQKVKMLVERRLV